MKIKTVHTFWSGLLAIMFLLACNKKETAYYGMRIEPVVYNGNAIEYLKSQRGIYDSMLAVLGRYPDMIRKITSGDSLTLFAIPNNSFKLAVENFNNYRRSIDSAPLYLKPGQYDLSRPDSGMFNYEGLRVLMARYIVDGSHPFEELAQASGGIPFTSYDYAYKMNLKAIQESSAGSANNGPKVIEFSDMNFSLFRRFWKSAYTSSVATARAGNVLVHALAQDHEFGFSSFTSTLADFSIDRSLWKPIGWHSIAPTTNTGGTVAHAFDGSLVTFWHTLYPGYAGYKDIPPPYYFTVDMGRNNNLSGVAVQNRQETISSAWPGRTVRFLMEFAADTTQTKTPLQWMSSDTFSFPETLSFTVYAKQRFAFPQRYNARFFRFTVLQNYGGFASYKYVNLAEMWLY
ncbi:discoidin domain-containing protein [Niabella sp.]|uniref:discoidin domain-containing protein n=1 Tax=Niabella sp. TaxID=1962976 RepID=UPI0026346E63|nr:discoidin domain-containing protein [Niabella sp.]